MSDQPESKTNSNEATQMSDEALALRKIEALLGQIIFAQRLARSEQKHIEEVINRLEKRGTQSTELSLAYVAAGRLNDARSALKRVGSSGERLPAGWFRLSVAALAKHAQFTFLRLSDTAVGQALEDAVPWALEIAVRRALEDEDVRRALEDETCAGRWKMQTCAGRWR